MENAIFIAFSVSLLFCLFKIVEMKFLSKTKEAKPLKFFVRDAILVFISSLLSSIVFFSLNGGVSDFVNTLTETKVISTGAPEVFTDAPGF
jgi:hypothetical protein